MGLLYSLSIDPKRFCECPLYRPMLESPIQGLFAYSDFVSPIGHCLCFPIVSNLMVIPSIAALFVTCSPAAVFGRIRAIVVNAINRVLRRWTRPHIPVKVSKVLLPAVTDLNVTPAIIGIILVVGIRTPIHQPRPNTIFSTFPHSMFGIQGSGIFFLPTATTSGIPRFEPTGGNHSLCSTLATAKPTGTFLDDSSITYDQPTAKCLARQIVRVFRNLSIHGSILLMTIIIQMEKRGKLQQHHDLPYWGKWEDVLNGRLD